MVEVPGGTRTPEKTTLEPFTIPGTEPALVVARASVAPVTTFNTLLVTFRLGLI